MQVGKFTSDSTFDILGMEETNSSLVRNSTTVRFTYKDSNNNLIKYEKVGACEIEQGDYLIVEGNVLLPTKTYTRKSVAQVVARPDSTTTTKTIGDVEAFLIPIRFI